MRFAAFRSSHWSATLIVRSPDYCRSYSPLFTRFSTLNPAFLASEIESFRGELKVEKTRRTGFLHAGHFVKGAAESGRRSVKFPPQTLHWPSRSSYSYRGIVKKVRNSKSEIRTKSELAQRASPSLAVYLNLSFRTSFGFHSASRFS